MVKPPLRTKSIGFKVSEEEYAQLERAAQESGQTLGEWCREAAVLASANGEPQAATGPGGAHAIFASAVMAEVVALRAILLNMLFKIANGQTLTAEEMQRLIDRADSDKVTRARAHLGRAAGPEEKS